MHLVDRHRLVERVDVGARGRRTRQLGAIDDDRSGGGAHFRAKAERIGLQRQQCAGAGDDLVFVFVAGARARHEDFPIAVAAHAHGMAAAVPDIEVADHTDALRIRRPHHEADAGDAVQRHGWAPSFS